MILYEFLKEEIVWAWKKEKDNEYGY